MHRNGKLSGNKRGILSADFKEFEFNILRCEEKNEEFLPLSDELLKIKPKDFSP